MSRLLVVTPSTLAPGFRLAGVETFPAESAGQAQAIVAQWLDAGETGLAAIDEKLLAGMSAEFRRRLDASERLLCLAIPSGERRAEASEGMPERLVADLIRQAIGLRITFDGEQSEHG